MSAPWPPPGYPPGPPPSPAERRPGSGVRLLVILALVAIVGTYLLTVLVTKDEWADAGPTERTRLTFAAQPKPGAPASPEALADARDLIERRVAARGVSDAEVTVDGDTIAVTVAPGDDGDDLRDIGSIGRLLLRPVIQAIPARKLASTTPRNPAFNPPAQQIADEKQLRQSTDQSIQMLGLQFQAGRCNDDDALVGNDDPKLPLVTCSADNKTVYLLAASIITGQQIDSATAGHDQQSDQNVVTLQFDEEAAGVWADFTAGHIGTQTAFTVDTRVVSAPQIAEAIPGGRTQIAGSFTADGARDLAATLGSGALPFPMVFQSTDTVLAERESGFTPLRIGLIAGGIVVGLAVIGGLLLVVALGRRGYAADVTRYTS